MSGFVPLSFCEPQGFFALVLAPLSHASAAFFPIVSAAMQLDLDMAQESLDQKEMELDDAKVRLGALRAAASLNGRHQAAAHIPGSELTVCRMHLLACLLCGRSMICSVHCLIISLLIRILHLNYARVSPAAGH